MDTPAEYETTVGVPMRTCPAAITIWQEEALKDIAIGQTLEDL